MQRASIGVSSLLDGRPPLVHLMSAAIRGALMQIKTAALIALPPSSGTLYADYTARAVSYHHRL